MGGQRCPRMLNFYYLKVLKKDVEKLIASKPVGDHMRDWFEAVFKKEMSKSNDLGVVDKFYWQVRSGYDLEQDSDSSVDLD